MIVLIILLLLAIAIMVLWWGYSKYKWYDSDSIAFAFMVLAAPIVIAFLISFWVRPMVNNDDCLDYLDSIDRYEECEGKLDTILRLVCDDADCDQYLRLTIMSTANDCATLRRNIMYYRKEMLERSFSWTWFPIDIPTACEDMMDYQL